MSKEIDQEVLEIQRKIREGDQKEVDYLFAEFIDKNRGKILYFISPFTALSYVDKDVFFNAACMVIFEKIKTFDPDNDNRASFWTYAKPAVRFEAMRDVDAECNFIQIPYYQRVEVEKLRKKARAMGLDLTQMSVDDMELHLGVDNKNLENILPYIRREFLYSAELDETEQEELMHDNTSHLAEESVTDFFHVLTRQEENLMRMRYGLHPYEHEHKLREIAQEYKMDVPRLSVLLKKCRARIKEAIEQKRLDEMSERSPYED